MKAKHIFFCTLAYTVIFIAYVFIASAVDNTNSGMGYLILATPFITVASAIASSLAYLIFRNVKSSVNKYSALYLSPIAFLFIQGFLVYIMSHGII